MSHDTVYYSRPRTYGKAPAAGNPLPSPPFPSIPHPHPGADVQRPSSSRVTGDKKKAGVIRKYGLNMSRQAFREKAADIGFTKVCTLILILIITTRGEGRGGEWC
ncbi:40S ribosomal protein S29 [Teratosphaeria destructans]|uniref:40S ribosomal protein S29 n=1 Tax=Teratosphaeria destructans TaxID=418781 RepID=A0A9W7SNE2_9PEZI|nr:40S ribosomal protein S29 [Teratosphaeria destructans]